VLIDIKLPKCQKNDILMGFERSLLATAKANGIEPFAWLKDTLEK
jgi:hypothetical protein